MVENNRLMFLLELKWSCGQVILENLLEVHQEYLVLFPDRSVIKEEEESDGEKENWERWM